ncbi:MAG: sulfatase [Phocaeicola sp.]|uniref:sulfatase n=1 Tax=Phocaeicola sp. TaxID=2773926 RepID=UPI003FA05B33
MTFSKPNNLLLLSCGLILHGSIASAGNTALDKDARPNIVLFMVDDMGWQDTSVPFWTQRTRLNDIYETPNMERLAAQGMMFTQAYACPISSPTRCSLMTGSNAARHRVTNWTLEKGVSTDDPDKDCLTPDWNYNGISQVTGTDHTYVGKSFVELFRENGYHTIHCGKAHWGAIGTPGENPTHFGFEVNIAGHAGGAPATYLSEHNYGNVTEGKPSSKFAVPGLEKYWGSGVFLTDALTREAISALRKAKEYHQPFYLYMSQYAIHIPIDRDMRFFNKYILKGLSEKESAYASLIEGMDCSLGKIMDWLDENDETENTIFIFMSDNGGYATGTQWRDEPLFTQNAPLKCGKGSLYEGGIREPMIVRWPGKVAAGSRCDHYLMIEDFYPTLLEMAGIHNYKVPQTIDGRSFMPMLLGTGNTSKGRMLIWNYPNVWGNDGPGISLNCAIRKDDWKLIYDYKTGRKELYNIPKDIGEQINLAPSHPEIVRNLSSELGRSLRSMHAQRPTFKETGLKCPWPDEVK